MHIHRTFWLAAVGETAQQFPLFMASSPTLFSDLVAIACKSTLAPRNLPPLRVRPTDPVELSSKESKLSQEFAG